MQHQYYKLGSVKAHRFPNLLQYELTVGFVLGRRQALRTTGDLDRVRISNSQPFQEFRESQLKAVVKTPDDSGITVIFGAGRIEMKDLLHRGDSSFVVSLGAAEQVANDPIVISVCSQPYDPICQHQGQIPRVTFS